MKREIHHRKWQPVLVGGLCLLFWYQFRLSYTLMISVLSDSKQINDDMPEPRAGLTSKPILGSTSKLEINSKFKTVPGKKVELLSETTLTKNNTKSNENKKQKLWFLHIPKTGSTLIRSMIQQACPTQSAEEVQKIFRLVLKGRHKDDFPCAKSIQPGHTGLKAIHDRSSVVMMVRDPLDRVISGFLHNLHDCSSLQKRFSIDEHDDPADSMGGICGDVRNVVRNSEQRESKEWQELRGRIHKLVSDYMGCVQGCSRNMILGGNKCKRPKETMFSNATLHGHKDDLSIEVNRRIESLAFVGVTNEWEKSMCLWKHTFPSHKDGRGDYLFDDDFGKNALFRRTPLNDCQEDLKNLISSDEELMVKISKDPDWLVFNRSLQLLEERLPQQCQATSNTIQRI